KQGKLPPVEQRLPEEPLVVVPEEEVGQYGGTWRRVWKGPADYLGVMRVVWVHLIFWNKEGTSFVPGLAKKWEVSPDGKTFTFYLRKGVKWSDGKPFTVDDLVFWIEDVVGNDELTPTKPAWYLHGGQKIKYKKIDDYTLVLEFAKPYPLFLFEVAQGWGGFWQGGHPAHYLKKFHPRYTSMEELKSIMEKEGYSTWVALFNAKNSFIDNLEKPVLTPWKPITSPTGQFFLLERNPYFWAIDVEGNQLPYIDNLRYEYVASDELIKLKAIAGEIDMQNRHIGTMAFGQDYVLFKENEKKGGYKIINWRSPDMSLSAVALNYTHPDPVLREIFNDKRFRQALSLAINREEINEIVYYGLAKPMQAAFVEGAAYYDPLWERAYADYNPDLANKLLDEMGLQWDRTRSYRLRPDGKPLQFTVMVISQPHIDIWTMVKNYWAKIGVKIEVESVERSLFEQRCASNEWDAHVWAMDGSTQPLSLPYSFLPLGTMTLLNWYLGWLNWINPYLAGQEPPQNAIRPPEEVIRLVDLWKKISIETDPKKVEEMMREVTKIHRENIWVIGTVGAGASPTLVKENMKNVPKDLYVSWPLRTPLNAMPIQFFFKLK
ncbi:MAG: ABC transporter substrate-binding protein, partial [Archaeoglobaceae archaeon]